MGNLNAKRDWGHAEDYVEMQWRILQQKNPDDYVVATGQTHTVRQFIDISSKMLGINIFWKGEGIKEIGYIKEKSKNKIIVKIDKKYFRPNEVDYLKGDASKALKKLKFKPKYNFKSLIKDMLEKDMILARKELYK